MAANINQNFGLDELVFFFKPREGAAAGSDSPAAEYNDLG